MSTIAHRPPVADPELPLAEPELLAADPELEALAPELVAPEPAPPELELFEAGEASGSSGIPSP